MKGMLTLSPVAVRLGSSAPTPVRLPVALGAEIAAVVLPAGSAVVAAQGGGVGVAVVVLVVVVAWVAGFPPPPPVVVVVSEFVTPLLVVPPGAHRLAAAILELGRRSVSVDQPQAQSRTYRHLAIEELSRRQLGREASTGSGCAIPHLSSPQTGARLPRPPLRDVRYPLPTGPASAGEACRRTAAVCEHVGRIGQPWPL